jgi:hypothetical protein
MLITSTAAALGITAYHHIVVTADGTTGRMYIDGTQVGTGTRTLPLPTGNSTGVVFFAAGNSGGSPSQPLNGTLDDISIFTTYMTSTTVTAHRNSGLGI